MANYSVALMSSLIKERRREVILYGIQHGGLMWGPGNSRLNRRLGFVCAYPGVV